MGAPVLKLLIPESPMQVLPSLACAIGLEDAIVLQQFHYWLLRAEKDEDGVRWFAAPMDRLVAKFPFLSRRTLERIVARLEAGGMLRSRRPRSKQHDQTKHYTVVYDAVPGPIDTVNETESHTAKLTVSDPPARRDVLGKEEEKQQEEKTEGEQRVLSPDGDDGRDALLRVNVPVHRRPYPIPQPYPLNDAIRSYYWAKGCTAADEAHEAFVDYFVGAGTKKASWPATERTWVRNSHGPAPRYPCVCLSSRPKGDGLSQSMRNVRAVAAKYRAEGRL